jgi:small ligand-binding sensory domain FIST
VDGTTQLPGLGSGWGNPVFVLGNPVLGSTRLGGIACGGEQSRLKPTIFLQENGGSSVRWRLAGIALAGIAGSSLVLQIVCPFREVQF